MGGALRTLLEALSLHLQGLVMTLSGTKLLVFWACCAFKLKERELLKLCPVAKAS